jgi:Ca2+-binding RTX toxin-like protein
MSKKPSKKTALNSRNHPRPAGRENLGYSCLEDRKLLAVVGGAIPSDAITFNPNNSVLRIQGTDDVADQLFVATPNEAELRINFNGQFSILDRTAISQIRFVGLGGNDVFNGTLSDITAVVLGGEGNDRLFGGGGADRLVGGAGSDTIIGGGADDMIIGDQGNDFLNGGGGQDQVVGGDGDDTLIGATGNDTLIGGNGLDRLDGGEGSDRLFGGAGNDAIFGRLGNDTVNGNDGDDFINGGQDDDFLQGGQGNDRITGQQGIDRIFGLSGDDVISGNDGNDVLFGGEGNDSVSGGEGDDTISGEAGQDLLNGDQGIDLIFGGADNDTITGGSGDDSLFGQFGSDRIFGGTGNDRVVGEQGNDFLVGGFGDDTIIGGDGQDRLFGNGGRDDLRGGAGADGLFGGVGSIDRIAGEGGSDRLIVVGTEELIGVEAEDAQVVFRNGSAAWTAQEIAVIDQGLQRLQLRLGNNRLSIDPLIDGPIVFVKENTLPPGISLAENRVVQQESTTFDAETGIEQTVEVPERQYVFADWNESSAAENALRSLEVPRAIAITWASSEAVGAVVPTEAEVFNQFTVISAWRTTPGGDFFRVSEDNSSFYRQDALFADETGRINATQDWASAWQLAFTPGADAARAVLFSKLDVLDDLFDELATA